jgi:hypothetical protein
LFEAEENADPEIVTAKGATATAPRAVADRPTNIVDELAAADLGEPQP